MAAAGAAIATVFSQAVSVVTALVMLLRKGLGIEISRSDFALKGSVMRSIVGIGVPTAAQDGFIQVSFLVITAIANQRGVEVAAGVGIVEKIISFLFLVPSAMLSSVSAIAAQNAGAGRHDNGLLILRYAMTIAVAFGLAVAVALQFFSAPVVGLFTDDAAVIELGRQYLTAYVWDVACAGVHFCFSGYFCAYRRAYLSFIHNCIAICLVRIPGAYLASVLYPNTLYPMGAVVPLGSVLSATICVFIFCRFRKSWYTGESTA